MTDTAPDKPLHRAPAERWKEAWAVLGIDNPGLTKAGADIAAAYGGAGRHYHDVRHLEDVLWHLDWAKTAMQTTGDLTHLNSRERWEMFAVVELALWYHDAVYDPKAKDNEQKSKEWFLKDAAAFGLDPAIQARVANLIDLTVNHRNAKTLEENLMADCDLSIFGASPAKFRGYDTDIRREYAHVPTPLFKAGRTKVLSDFLNQPQIFKTKAFQQYYEPKARQNLKDALASPMKKLLSLFRK